MRIEENLLFEGAKVDSTQNHLKMSFFEVKGRLRVLLRSGESLKMSKTDLKMCGKFLGMLGKSRKGLGMSGRRLGDVWDNFGKS